MAFANRRPELLVTSTQRILKVNECDNYMIVADTTDNAVELVLPSNLTNKESGLEMVIFFTGGNTLTITGTIDGKTEITPGQNGFIELRYVHRLSAWYAKGINGADASSQSRTLYCNPNVSGLGDGSKDSPYKYAQSAIAWVEASGSPSGSNPWLIDMAAGTYVENLLVRLDGVNLEGRGRDLTVVAPATGVALLVGNVTTDSFATFNSTTLSGDLDPITRWTAFVRDTALDTGNYPSKNKISGLHFNNTDVSGTAYPVMVAFKGTIVSDQANNLQFTHCYANQGMFLRAANMVRLHDVKLENDLYTRSLANGEARDVVVGGRFIADHLSADTDIPQFISILQWGMRGHNLHVTKSAIIQNDAKVKSGIFNGFCRFSSAVAVETGAELELNCAQIQSLTVGTDAKVNFFNVWCEGAVTMHNTAAASTWAGGLIGGALTDGGAKLTTTNVTRTGGFI